MKRRAFLCAAGAAGLVATSLSTLSAEEKPAKREFIELRAYTVSSLEKRDQLVKILDEALIPALNRQGVKPVGVFMPQGNDAKNQAKYENNVFVVIPYKTAETFLNLTAKLLADETYMKQAAAIFEATSKDPVYTACDSQLLHCFETAPVLEQCDLGPDRAFEMRLYRSFNIERNASKIHMFEHGGELALFRELGLNPIFFGETVFGKKIPNLTYMVGSENAEKLAACWKNFGPNPKWHAIRDNQTYKDTATEIDRVILKPSPGSQL